METRIAGRANPPERSRSTGQPARQNPEPLRRTRPAPIPLGTFRKTPVRLGLALPVLDASPVKEVSPMKDASPVKVVVNSQNRKLGGCHATYAAQESCPSTCRFYRNGCYAESGPVGLLTRGLNAVRATPTQIAHLEAQGIGRLPFTAPIRLHVVGDCKTAATARIVAAAADQYTARSGYPCWSYSHAWERVPRTAWGGVSVLASCETPDQAERAMRRGYAAALVLPRSPADGRTYRLGTFRVVPCPYETRGKTCMECRLCWDDKKLREQRLVIGFTAHGSGAPKIRKALEDVYGEQ